MKESSPGSDAAARGALDSRFVACGEDRKRQLGFLGYKPRGEATS